MTPAEPMRRSGIISRWLATYPIPRGETDADAELRLANYMDALSDIPADILDEAFRLSVRSCKFMPTPAEVFEHAGPAMKDRLADMRIERERIAAANRVALSAPVDDPTFDTSDILAKCFAQLDAGYQRMEGRPMPGSRHKASAIPRNVSTAPRMPTEADYAEMRAIMAGKPVRERFEVSASDYAALGMGQPS